MTQSMQFWDKVADSYAKQPIADQATYEKKLEVTQKYLQPDMEVLEFGCGTGSTALIHAPHVKHIRAIDFSANMIKIARSKAEAQNIQNVTFEQASIDELSLPNQSIDVVLGLNVLHLLKDKETEIAKVYNILKPGGRFITSTVCLGGTMDWLKVVAPIGKFLRLFPLVRVFSVQELEQSLTDAGFEVEQPWQPSEFTWQLGSGKVAFIVATKAA
ncbi:class I SAM-dependent methyltransferase [Acaryochloris marina]|uniref:Methyltransferase n=1 Tax=Acaryochloris marina (strain MBIC 11017) TaxID=329726 RepID=B0CDS8_ACAM1|nr:class I SAM-dependent methyltransferase [Acaryochloris marina]ABW29280.1 methyltransferase [Acaryochloris marina MBIC11017]BDM78198.1 hypothetical protein AM10699_10680 [Acaryochloris marina MBIC10699]